MGSQPTRPLKQLLRDWSKGDEGALNQIMAVVYHDLHRIAGGYLRRERSDHTLQATALVHEAYLQLCAKEGLRLEEPDHFMALIARVMRRILVDHAREKETTKRGGDYTRVSLSETEELTNERSAQLVAIDECLEALAALDQQKATIVELHFFGGLTMAEIGELLGISRPTVVREWRRARMWLYREINACQLS